MGRIVGRNSERERLRARVEELISGTGGAVLLRGSIGIGKTVLLRDLLATATSSGVATFAVTGLEGGESLGVRVVERLAEQLGVVGHDGAPVALAKSIAARLSELARERPVLVCIDDVHWVDAWSAEVFAFVASLLFGERTLIAIAGRPRADVDHCDATSRLLSAADEVIDVTRLSRDATTDLLEQDGPIAPEVAATCWSICDGNPLALRSLRLDARQRLGATALDPTALRAPEALDDVFGRAWRGLPAGSQAWLAAAAITTIDVARLIDVSGVAPEDVEAAVAAGLIDRDRVEFSHPLVRAAIVHRLSPGERRAGHARLVEWLDGRADTDPAIRVWHLAGSLQRPDADAAEQVAEVAGAARARGAIRQALVLFERAASCHPLPSRRVSLLVDAAAAAFFGDLTGEATDLLDAAEALDPADLATRARLAEMRAHLRMWTQGPVASLPVIDAAIEDLHEELPDEAIGLCALGTVFAQLVPDGPRATRYAERAADLASRASDIGRIGSHFAVATAAMAVGDTARADTAFDAIDPVVAALADVAMPEYEHVLGAYAALSLRRERWADARVLLDKLVERADRFGATGQSVMFANTLGMLEWLRGDWLRALTLTRRTFDAADSTPVGKGLCCAGRAVVAASLGLVDEADEMISAVHDIAGGTQATTLIALAEWARGLLLLGQDDQTAAVGALRIAQGIIERGGMNEIWSAWWTADLIEALWCCGRFDEAHAELANYRVRAEHSRSHVAAIGLERVDGLLADEQCAAEAAFECSLRRAREVGLPFAEARTVLARARRRARAGDGLDADVADARARFERLGATGFASVAAGLTSSAAEPGGDDRVSDESVYALLTPAELRVVEVIVDGLTIADAAERLILSPKTIDSHLQHVYQRLGIHSRAELATRFAGRSRSQRANERRTARKIG